LLHHQVLANKRSMELLHYWRMLRRSWPLLLGLPLLVGLASLALALVQPRSYSARFAMLVTQRPLATNQETAILPDYNNVQNWIAAEYINDDIVELVRTQRFAQDVAGWIRQAHAVDIDPPTISRTLSAERRHRMVYFDVVGRDPQQTVWIGQGAVEMLRLNGLGYWNRSETTQLNVALLDQPAEATQRGGLPNMLANILVSVALAGLLALGIAVLRHSFDQHIRRRADIESLGLEVIGMIPKDARR
jgi:capsular polysaccharide biosynthesis protein